MKYILAITALLVSLASLAQPADITKQLDNYMQKMNERGLSASVICAKDGTILLEAGYGYSNQENKIANTPQTVSTVGSITKQFTAAAILKLESQGKLNVGMTLNELLPAVPQNKASITIHQLLTMSAGFVETLGDDYEKLDRTAFLERAMNSPLQFEPGTSYLYSNVNYSLLGAIIEIVSGQDYETYCRANLWLPAGMKNTGYVQPDWKSLELAAGYNKKGVNTGTPIEKVWDVDGPYWNLKCNGGVLSTCEDMYKWYLALQSDDILDIKQKIRMYTPYLAEGPAGQSHYGYGWSIVTTQRNTRLITHNGGNGIYFADYLNFEDENTFVYVSSNASKKGMQDVAWELGRMILMPDYEPEIREYDPQPVFIKDISNTDFINTLGNLIAYMEGNSNWSEKEFIQSNLGQGLLESIPLEEHIDLLVQFRKTLDGAIYQDLLQAGNEFYMNFSFQDGTTRQLFVELNEMGKIRGLGFPE